MQVDQENSEIPYLEVTLAEPRGFCAGVDRAVKILENLLEKYGPPLYVNHDIVHNKHVVSDFSARGVVFGAKLPDIPSGSILVLSAHGVTTFVEKEARDRGLKIVDATCPLVKKIHIQVEQIAKEDIPSQVILVGHKNHPEVIGIMGRSKDAIVHLVGSCEEVDKLNIEGDGSNLKYITQTTLSVEETQEIIQKLKERFPKISGPGLKDICYATHNRQEAIKELAKQNEVVIVLGSEHSSNSNRLRDVAEKAGSRAYLIDDINAVDMVWFRNVKRVGISAGASAPEKLVTELLDFLKSKFLIKTVNNLRTVEENMNFKVPNIDFE